MAAISLLPPEEWEALKLANIRGATDEQLARQFEVTEESIRKRRSRDPVWQAAMSDRTHHSIVKTKVLQATDKAMSQDKPVIVTKANIVTLSASVDDILRENGQQSSLRASQIASASLSAAPDSLPVASLADVKTALQIARSAAGLDRAQVQVAMALSPGWGAAVQAEASAGDWEEEGGEVSQE